MDKSQPCSEGSNNKAERRVIALVPTGTHPTA